MSDAPALIKRLRKPRAPSMGGAAGGAVGHAAQGAVRAVDVAHRGPVLPGPGDGPAEAVIGVADVIPVAVGLLVQVVVLIVGIGIAYQRPGPDLHRGGEVEASVIERVTCPAGCGQGRQKVVGVGISGF